MARSITPTPIPPDAISTLCQLSRELAETQGYLPALERAVRTHDETLERHLEKIEGSLLETSRLRDDIQAMNQATFRLIEEIQGVGSKLDVLTSAIQGLSLIVQRIGTISQTSYGEIKQASKRKDPISKFLQPQ